MASSAEAISPSPGRRSLRRLLFTSSSSSRPHHAAADRSPLIGSPSLPPPPSSSPGRKKGLAAAAFRGFGCAWASASQAYAPAVRSSADWQGKRPRRRRGKTRKKERKGQVGGDVWCAPGIPFAAEASVDCVVAHQPVVGRGRPDAAERISRERSYIPRRLSHQEQISSFMDSPQHPDTTLFEPDLLRLGHLRNLRGYHRTPGGLEEIMMFQTRLLQSGGMEIHDRFRDWRLDVDNMSYEELLELGNKIGYVSTGLREEEITRSLRKIKQWVFDASTRHLSTEAEWKCSICQVGPSNSVLNYFQFISSSHLPMFNITYFLTQEEYEVNDEIGRLECGHSYHMYCIKQWLLLKNACPVCKTPVLKT
ncbi:hypothetical protein Cni_G25697 [Canna indica]|uniref:RING-type E3 ubiquitin transferase n=1 Tax=Canna indica TaxID=4628 RepID=A0AAQ3KY39_9LILI|nr:hypothetical protein Cni_G25697 [Canna indica]